MTTPYSGDGKGHMFTPEVGSQVLVNYEHGLANMPVVVGNVFHPQNKQGTRYSPPSNNLKGFQTAGGNKSVMVDSAQTQTILISNSNKKGTAIQMGFKGDGSITIKSEGAVQVLSPAITLEAGDKGEIKLHAKNITINAEENLQLLSGLKTGMRTQDMDAHATSTLTLDGVTNASLSSTQVEVSGNATTSIKGTLVTIN